MMNAPVTVGLCTSDSTPFTGQTMLFALILSNASFQTVHLSDVKVRYWFNADQNPVASIFFVADFAQNGNTQITSMVTGAFAAAPAANATSTSDAYLEISFGTGAGDLGVLGPPMAQLQARVHGPGANGFSDVFNETNDYSFRPMPKCGNSVFTTTQNVTAYLKGQLVWGCEPGSGIVTSTAGGGADSGSDSAPVTSDEAGGG